MAKETKIGLAVLGGLLVVFGGLLLRKLVLLDSASSPADVAARPAAAAAPDKGNVVVNAKNAEHGKHSIGIGRGSHRAPALAEVPTPAFPAASPRPAKELIPDRYAEDRAELAAEEDSSGDEPAARPDPFHRGSPAGGLGRESSEDAAGAPRRLRELSPEASRLEAHDPRHEPELRPRNPLRRVSAEEPINPEPINQQPTIAGGPGGEALSDATTIPDAVALPDAGGVPDAAPLTPEMPAAEEPSPAPRLAAIPAREDEPAQAEPVQAEPEPQPVVQAQLPRERYPERQPAAPVEPVMPENGKYTVQPNDTLSLISEKVYGNSRYFKALYEHNRAKLPHADKLSVGTVIAVPPASVLEQNYPALCPKQRKSALVKPRAVTASTRQQPARGDNVYVVAEGDTLFDIARYELGKAARWSEIYDLNRETLGSDFDYLQPGTELVMPPKVQSGDSITRQRDERYQR